MCAGYGYCCCCKCQYKFDGSRPFEVVRKTWAGTISEQWETVLVDEGSTIRCNGRVNPDVKLKPSLEFGHITSWENYYTPAHGFWYTHSTSYVFPEGWTYTPDGLEHTAKYTADWMLRRFWVLWNAYISPDNNRDIDVDSDPATIEGHDYENFFIAVRQNGQYFITLSPLAEPVTHIYGDGQSYPYGSIDSTLLTATWRRRTLSDGTRLPFAWSDATGAPPTVSWLRLLDPADATDFPYEYPYGGAVPDNTVGAADWEIGFAVTLGMSQQPQNYGQTTQEGLENGLKFWIDNVCLNIE